MLFAKIKKV